MKKNETEKEDARRPWYGDKRAWIFYWEKIKSDPQMVCGESDGNMYVLDCETVRLSIWVEKWGAFIDIGISNLLKRMSASGGGNQRGNLDGTRIFYKGIELQKRCLADDTELIEFIDIKGELERRYINISRNGFTEAGNRFFKEKLYPGLMFEIQKILRELEREAEENREGHKDFSAKICRVVERLCKDITESEKKEKRLYEKEFVKKKEDLISIVCTVAVLSYFAMRDEWNPLEGMRGRTGRKRMWEDLIEKIDGILNQPENENLLEELSRMTDLFNIRAYQENYKEYFERGERKRGGYKFNFLQIFLPDKHWAVLQCRRTE